MFETNSSSCHSLVLNNEMISDYLGDVGDVYIINIFEHDVCQELTGTTIRTFEDKVNYLAAHLYDEIVRLDLDKVNEEQYLESERTETFLEVVKKLTGAKKIKVNISDELVDEELFGCCFDHSSYSYKGTLTLYDERDPDDNWDYFSINLQSKLDIEDFLTDKTKAIYLGWG